jgi:hypothetical protein
LVLGFDRWGFSDIAFFKGLKYSEVRSTPLYFTLLYLTQLRNAIGFDVDALNFSQTEHLKIAAMRSTVPSKVLPDLIEPMLF